MIRAFQSQTEESGSSLYRAAYVSVPTEPLSDGEIKDLQEISLRNNRRDSITGLLILDEKTYLQVLEGPEGAVRTRLEIIENDRRHHQLHIFAESWSEERYLDHWALTVRGLGFVPEHFADSYQTLVKAFSKTPIRLNLSRERIAFLEQIVALQIAGTI